MNILVISPNEFFGCGFYRLYQPYNHLGKNYKIKVTFAPSIIKKNNEPMSDGELTKYTHVIWHKTYFDINDVKRCNDLGIVTIADFDDHWVLNPDHTLYNHYKKNNISVKLHKLLLTAQYITVTTELLGMEVYKHNKNVVVLPNAFDAGYVGWDVIKEDRDDFIFGYLGGSCHVRDVAMLRGLQAKLTEKESGYKISLFGYNGTEIYNFYANILSDEKRSKNFSLYKGTDIWNYPRFYNLIDCSLIPLEVNNFNRFKSELKLIEAGYFSKAAIVSNVEPYSRLIKHKKNCLAVNNKNEWYESCKMLLNNRQLAKDLGSQLNEDIQMYNINVVNQKRYKYLKACITEKIS